MGEKAELRYQLNYGAMKYNSFEPPYSDATLLISIKTPTRCLFGSEFKTTNSPRNERVHLEGADWTIQPNDVEVPRERASKPYSGLHILS